jgi:hypothetical protein
MISKLPPSTFVYEKEGDGHVWTVPEHKPNAKVECWWNRTRKTFQGKMLEAEHFILRQENPSKNPDVVVLDLGQVYGLIQVLNAAVLDT